MPFKPVFTATASGWQLCIAVVEAADLEAVWIKLSLKAVSASFGKKVDIHCIPGAGSRRPMEDARVMLLQ